MQVVLIMFRNGGERRSFSVARNLTTIGRREDCDLRIPVGDVSRKHCRLVLSADNIRVQDLGSSNGTYVNGSKVQDAFLNPGDTVSVGPVNFVVQIDGVPDEPSWPRRRPWPPATPGPARPGSHWPPSTPGRRRTPSPTPGSSATWPRPRPAGAATRSRDRRRRVGRHLRRRRLDRGRRLPAG